MKFSKQVFIGFLFVVCILFTADTALADNSAPVLDASRAPVLSSVLEDAGAPVGAVGTLVSALVDFAVPAGQVDNVTDVDGGTPGIAIIATDTTNLTCYYSINGGVSWFSLGSASGATARLLVANGSNRVYCQPLASGSFSEAIIFRAWDQSTGVDGATADTSTTGDATAFSTATDTASITVNAVDTTAPDTFIVSSTMASIDSTTTTIVFESDDVGATFECAIDTGGGPVYTSCVSPFSASLFLSGNTYTFSVRAIDGSDNVDATPAQVTWTVSDANVSSVSPADTATEVSTTTPIVFTFTSPVTADLRVRDAIIISSGPCASSCPVLVGVWNDDYTILTFTKDDGAFDYATTYTVELALNNGIVTGSLYEGTFTTVSPVTPSTTGRRMIANIPTELPLQKNSGVITPDLKRVLKLGMSGADIKSLQVYLNQHGFPVTEPGKETNYFGLKTKKAVQAFQKAHGLKTDGVVGPKTSKLFASIL